MKFIYEIHLRKRNIINDVPTYIIWKIDQVNIYDNCNNSHTTEKFKFRKNLIGKVYKTKAGLASFKEIVEGLNGNK
ncbi:MAG TPA: hypothetical protein PKA80_13440 [Ignavibacteriaceae bacterium]|nr:hypothetical protein [Ignavibacteriaceae bacterium]